MNIVLLSKSDFTDENRVVITDSRLEHLRKGVKAGGVRLSNKEMKSLKMS